MITCRNYDEIINFITSPPALRGVFSYAKLRFLLLVLIQK